MSATSLTDKPLVEIAVKFPFLKLTLNCTFEIKLFAMTFKQVCLVNNNQVLITLPPNFINKKQVTVLIDDQVDSREQKLAQLKAASKDPLFLADIFEINKDFDSIDSETI